MHPFLMGIASATCWAIGVVFLRTWRVTRDRFFLLFALAFWTLSVTWVMLGALTPAPETQHYFYLFRLAAFGLIIIAIIDRNRRN